MKSILSLLVIISFVSVTASCNSQVRDEKKQEQVAGADIIEVYYFHFTRRCATCNAVENETQIALKEFYPGKIDAGDIVFISINLEEEENDALAKKTGSFRTSTAGSKRKPEIRSYQRWVQVRALKS